MILNGKNGRVFKVKARQYIIGSSVCGEY